MRPDPFSAAAKPFSVPYEESLESRSARKAQKSQSFTSQPSSTLTVEFASWSLEDTWSSCSSPDGQKTSVSFPEAEWSAKATDQQQPASFGQGAPRARRNSSSRSTLVALGRKISSSSQASSLEDIQSTIDRAVENGSTDVDLSFVADWLLFFHESSKLMQIFFCFSLGLSDIGTLRCYQNALAISATARVSASLLGGETSERRDQNQL